MFSAILEHALLGGVFACTGAGARCLCRSCVKRLVLGGALVVIEAIVMVGLIG